MGVFEFLVVAVVFGTLSQVVTTWMRTRHSQGGQQVQDLERRIQALEAQQQELKALQALPERVHVLESIVTTDEFELQRKFRELEGKK
jgi:hypothetical protein